MHSLIITSKWVLSTTDVSKIIFFVIAGWILLTMLYSQVSVPSVSPSTFLYCDSFLWGLTVAFTKEYMDDRTLLDFLYLCHEWMAVGFLDVDTSFYTELHTIFMATHYSGCRSLEAIGQLELLLLSCFLINAVLQPGSSSPPSQVFCGYIICMCRAFFTSSPPHLPLCSNTEISSHLMG